MHVTVKEYSARTGISGRTIREKLAHGQLAGFKQKDPTTGTDTWFVALIDTPRAAMPTHGRKEAPPLHPMAASSPAPQQEASVPRFVVTELLEKLNRLEDAVERMHRENVELAGRVGFYQAKLQEAETKIALLEAPQAVSQEAHRRPWWRFWRS